MAQILFSQIYMHLAKTSERWENLYTASSTRRKHSANVVMAQWKRPCHTKPRFHCVGTELFKFPECREISSKSWFFSRKRAYHGVLTATMTLLQSSHGILSFLRSSRWRAYDAFTALSRRSQCVYCVHTALTACWRRSAGIFPPFRSVGQGPVEFEKIAFESSKFGYIYSV